jgi:hypothetical protein
VSSECVQCCGPGSCRNAARPSPPFTHAHRSAPSVPTQIVGGFPLPPPPPSSCVQCSVHAATVMHPTNCPSPTQQPHTQFHSLPSRSCTVLYFWRRPSCPSATGSQWCAPCRPTFPTPVLFPCHALQVVRSAVFLAAAIMSLAIFLLPPSTTTTHPLMNIHRSGLSLLNLQVVCSAVFLAAIMPLSNWRPVMASVHFLQRSERKAYFLLCLVPPDR